MKLSKYGEQLGLTYKTTWRMFHNGHIPGAYQLPSGTIIVPDKTAKPIDAPLSVAIYARVSSSQNKSNLNSQCDRLAQYCAARGYHVIRVVKEVGSGVNDKRKQFISLLTDGDIDLIVVEHRDRATRFGFNYIQSMLEESGRCIEVINDIENDKDELMHDLIAIITSFTARYYGRRRAARKTEKLIKELRESD